MQFLWNFPTKQRIFHLFLGNLKKTQGIFQKTQGSEKKLNVVEATCLRLPPKNRAKNSPVVSSLSCECSQTIWNGIEKVTTLTLN